MMAHGIAVCVGPAGPAWHEGSQIFQLYPSLGQFEGLDDLVVVAVTPAAVDHGNLEATVFKCDAQGATGKYGGLDGGAEALSPSKRIIGRYDVDAVLANLAGGYVPVTPAQYQALRPSAIQRARGYASDKLKMQSADADDYAHNNWGIFAGQAATFAMHLQSNLHGQN